MKEIQLTQEQVALVDDADYEWLSQWNWRAMWSKNTDSFYAVRTEYHPFRREVLMHREIMSTPKNLKCDHLNHDTLNNTKSNLRNVTNSQNQMNRKGASTNNKLKERGICIHGKGYKVQIMKDGVRVVNKTFSTLKDAISHRDSSLERFYGEFGYKD